MLYKCDRVAWYAISLNRSRDREGAEALKYATIAALARLSHRLGATRRFDRGCGRNRVPWFHSHSCPARGKRNTAVGGREMRLLRPETFPVAPAILSPVLFLGTSCNAMRPNTRRRITLRRAESGMHECTRNNGFGYSA
jgi:hypothetical protein